MFKCKKLKYTCRAVIDGEMTIYNAAELKRKLAAVLEDARGLEIHLGQVTEIDSAGIQLLMLTKKAREARQLATSLVEYSEEVLAALNTMGLVPYFGEPAAVTRA